MTGVASVSRFLSFGESIEPDLMNRSNPFTNSPPPPYNKVDSMAEQRPPRIRASDIVIAVMGMTGSGKSTFISHFASTAKAGDGLESYTNKVEIHEASIDDQRVFLIDTPGFDDSYRTETDVLREIADWLNRSYRAHIKLSGIVYLHRINDNRLGGTALRNLRMFKMLCGEDRLSCVVLATTMWGLVPWGIALQREVELQKKEDFWAGMIRKGSKVFRQDREVESGLQILRHILDLRQPVTLQIQEEMAINGRPLDQTGAGVEVQAEITRLTLKYEKELSELKAEIRDTQRQNDREHAQALAKLKADLEAKMQKERDDQERMRVDMDQLQKQRDAELREEQERSRQQELQFVQDMAKREAAIEAIRAKNINEAQLAKAKLKADMQKAETKKYRERLKRINAQTCTIM